MVNYATFTSKYPVFSKVSEPRFNGFLADAVAEISLRNWGTLKDRATEMLIGCMIASCPTDASLVNASGTIKAIKVDGEYEVQYDSSSSSSSKNGSWFCSEYQRLLALLEQQKTAAKPALHFHATRELKYPTNTPRSFRTGTGTPPYRGVEGEGYRER